MIFFESSVLMSATVAVRIKARTKLARAVATLGSDSDQIIVFNVVKVVDIVDCINGFDVVNVVQTV